MEVFPRGYLAICRDIVVTMRVRRRRISFSVQWVEARDTANTASYNTQVISQYSHNKELSCSYVSSAEAEKSRVKLIKRYIFY